MLTDEEIELLIDYLTNCLDHADEDISPNYLSNPTNDSFNFSLSKSGGIEYFR